MPDESIHVRLERERKAAQPDADLVRCFREYARGRHRGTLTPEQQAILRSLVGNRFCDNVCKQVLLAAVGRVQLTRYSVANDTVETWLQDWWTRSALPRLQGQVHWAAFRDGNTAVALAWDNTKKQVRLARERWWDGKSGLWVAYDDQDTPAYAVKEWDVPIVGKRRVIWWPDRIERWVAGGAGWEPYRLDPNAPDSWRDAWTDSRGRPLGLPVVHFPNAYLPTDGDDVDSLYGTSELDGGVLGLQDEINDVQRDLTAAARLTAFQMIWGSGITLTKDAENKPVPIRIAIGTALTSEKENSRWGVLAAGDLKQLELTLRIKLQAVSRITSTPQHLITGGDWPSGEALLRADRPLADKGTAIVRTLGPPWAFLAHKATLLANAFGNAGLDTAELITAVFAPTDDPDKLKLAQIAKAVAPYVSDEEVLRVLQYPPDEITRIMAERQAAAPPPTTVTGTENLDGGGAAALAGAQSAAVGGAPSQNGAPKP